MDTISELRKQIKELENSRFDHGCHVESINQKIQSIQGLIVVLEHLNISRNTIN